MKYRDNLSEHYSSLLEGSYDCIDRLVLNAYCTNLHIPGGLRLWFRALKGTDKGLDNNQLMRFSGRFSRRVKAFAESKNIPLIYFQAGERKHEKAEELLPEDQTFTGIFAIFVSKASALLWEIKKFENDSIDIRRKKKPSYVNHYSFHIIDRKWGHITIKICSHPPFSCQIILNGHEWVERREGFKKLDVTKEDNCFTSYLDGDSLSQVADALKEKGQLEVVCNRWIYGCLWFAMDYEEQKRTYFRYNYSLYQIEYSRNFLFQRGTCLDDVYQNIIDLTRKELDIKRLQTIFGRKNRPHNRKSGRPGFEVRIEKPDYNLTIFKIHFGKLTLKLYDKGERTLRAEVVVHNAKELKCRRGIPFFSEIVTKLQEIMNNFVNNLKYVHVALINNGSLEHLVLPTQRGNKRLAGVDINKERNLAVMETVLALSVKPHGYTAIEVAKAMKEKFDQDYSPRNASYDLRKLKGKGLVEKKKGTRKYVTTSDGLQTIIMVLSLIRNQIPKALAVLRDEDELENKKEMSPMEKHYFTIMNEVKALRQLYGIKIAA